MRTPNPKDPKNTTFWTTAERRAVAKKIYELLKEHPDVEPYAFLMAEGQANLPPNRRRTRLQGPRKEMSWLGPLLDELKPKTQGTEPTADAQLEVRLRDSLYQTRYTLRREIREAVEPLEARIAALEELLTHPRQAEDKPSARKSEEDRSPANTPPPTAPGKPAPPKPRVIVVGCFPHQQSQVWEKVRPRNIEIRFVSRDRHSGKAARGADKAVLLTKFVEHRHQEELRSVLGRDRVHLHGGGLSSLASLLKTWDREAHPPRQNGEARV